MYNFNVATEHHQSTEKKNVPNIFTQPSNADDFKALLYEHQSVSFHITPTIQFTGKFSTQRHQSVI